MPSKIDETLFGWEMAGVGATNRERWRMIPASIWWLYGGRETRDVKKIGTKTCRKLSLSVFYCSAFGVQMSTPMKLSQS